MGLSLSTHKKIARNKGDSTKINQGVRAFFGPIFNPQEGSPNHQELLFVRPYYGCGATIISISILNICLNPALKGDDLISL